MGGSSSRPVESRGRSAPAGGMRWKSKNALRLSPLRPMASPDWCISPARIRKAPGACGGVSCGSTRGCGIRHRLPATRPSPPRVPRFSTRPYWSRPTGPRRSPLGSTAASPQFGSVALAGPEFFGSRRVTRIAPPAAADQTGRSARRIRYSGRLNSPGSPSDVIDRQAAGVVPAVARVVLPRADRLCHAESLTPVCRRDRPVRPREVLP